MKIKLSAAAFLLIILAILYTGCHETVNINTHKVIAKPGDTIFYTGLYIDTEGVKFFSEKDSINRLLFKATSVEKVNVSPSESIVAFVAVDSIQQECSIYSFDIESGKATLLKKTSENAAVRLFWEDDTLLYVNICETKSGKPAKQRPTLTGNTELLNVNQNSIVQKIKPAKGVSLEALLPDKYFVFSDADGVYTIEKGKNRLVKSLKGFSMSNMKDLQFSSDGKKLSYIEPKTVNDQFGGSHQRNELYIANSDGSKAQRIIDYNYDPQHAAWSPAGGILACDVISQDWGNLRNVALYNAPEGKLVYNTEEENGFVPNLSTCLWSPLGMQYIVTKKVVNQFFKKEGFILHNLESGKSFTMKDSAGQELEATVIGSFTCWFSENILAFRQNDRFTVYNISARKYTAFPQGKILFYLRERL